MINSRNRCRTCHHFDAFKPDSPRGLCRIDPPGRYESKQVYSGGWPVTADDDTCSKHITIEDGRLQERA